MPRFVLALAAIVALAIGLASPRPAAAEGFLDVFIGGSWNETTDATFKTDVFAPVAPGATVGASLQARLQDVSTRGSLTGGLRGGYMFESVPVVDLGVGLDVAFLPLAISPQQVQGSANGTVVIDIDTQNNSGTITIPAGVTTPVDIPSTWLTTFTFAVPFFLRYPMLVSEARPRGLVQPYIQVGPAFALTNENQAVIPGPLVGGGFGLAITNWLYFFSEYRYTAFPGIFKVGDVKVNGVKAGDVRVEADLYTHRWLSGLSFRF